MKRFLIVLAACSLLAVPALAGDPPAGQPASSEPSVHDTLYALGVEIGKSIEWFDLSQEEAKIIGQGIADAVAGKAKLDSEALRPAIQKLQEERRARYAAKQKAAGKAYIDAFVEKEGATRLANGAAIKTIKPGTGESPAETDTVKVHYTGTLIDGTKFDSSRDRGQPATFPLARIIPCWKEGLQKMKVGERAKLVCPSDTAYGDHGRPPVIKPGATLVFDVELLGIEKPQIDNQGQPPAQQQK